MESSYIDCNGTYEILFWSSIMASIEQWADDLSLLPDGTERLTYLVELARKETNLSKELRTDDRLIGGCISKICRCRV